MSRIVTKRISRSQLEKMADFLEKYPQMTASGVKGSSDKPIEQNYRNKLWRELADILNAEPHGAKKSALKWRKCLRDYKCCVKKKYLNYLADSSNLSPLTYLDVKYLATMGYVVDLEGVDYPNGQPYSQLEEDTGKLANDVTIIPNEEEPKQKFYHAPEIITIFPNNFEFAATGDQTLKTKNSRVKEDAHEKDERPSNNEPSNVERPKSNEPSNVERPKSNEPSNVERPKSNEPSNVERLQNNETSSVGKPQNNEPSIEELTSTKTSSLNPKTSPKKKVSSSKKTSGVITKNATAVALHAIARELCAKNELTKRKIELETEKLQLEKRKIEAFELIAKRLCRR